LTERQRALLAASLAGHGSGGHGRPLTQT
jgi:hypothetical protein